METTVDSYLHKKFKKQLSIEPRTVVVAASAEIPPKRCHNVDGVETSTDQRWRREKGGGASEAIVLRATDDAQLRRRRDDHDDDEDNIHQHHHTVPNSSTNHYRSDSVGYNDSIANAVKSSISLETNPLVNIQDTRANISYVRNVQDDDNYDNKFSCNVGLKSSNLDGNLYKYNYNDNEGDQTNNEPNSRNNKDDNPIQQQQQPDKTTTGGKYVCTYCNLACSKPSVLQKHIRAHTNERPYPCVSCGFSFKTRSNLYKHCRSRTHANRVLGSKARGELMPNDEHEAYDANNVQPNADAANQEPKTKLYKPRFHTIGASKTYNQSEQPSKENIEDENNRPTDILSHHINDIINKNNAKINADTYLKPSLNSECANVPQRVFIRDDTLKLADEPLNLTNKGRKRCISDAVESKSLIKELLLQNLSSDMQCPHCKMIFQTVTELELHKLRSCKGFVRPGAKYTRSSSVNVASILTQNKNAFDTIPQMQFPLKSPGPFLGKTRLVDSDKGKSFSFDDGLPNITSMYPAKTSKYLLSPLKLQNEEKKTPVKLFGGEVKITETTGESKSFNIDKHDAYESSNFLNYGGKMSENRVIKSGLHSGGTVLTNKGNFGDNPLRSGYDPTPETSIFNEQRKRPPDLVIRATHDELSSPSPSYIKYTNIIDFSQNAVKLLTPNLKQPNLTVPGVPVPVPNKFTYSTTLTPSSPLTQPLKIEVGVLTTTPVTRQYHHHDVEPQNLYNPMNILVDGKVVRYVPGIPGPVVAAETPVDMRHVPKKTPVFEKLEISVETPSKFADATTAARSPVIKTTEMKSPPQLLVKNEKKFARPNSLALKPTSASLKQHHGLTPTMFNQILISPDTPRVAKKYVQQYLNGNYFSYLGLKSTTKPVYCTLNKTQPFYVPHFKTLSMYSEWRQQDTKTDKLYVAGYDSRQKSSRYTVAGLKNYDLMAHSSYKSTTPDSLKEKDDGQKTNPILGGYECNEDYTYIRGRGRGRYVCEQCGIRCKKPSMLKKHIRTHSNDRPYTCSHCNFSFKTKGNLTKHMKSKAHTKNSTTSSCSSSSTQQSGTPSSESDTEDSGMDSSDESTRQQEHEAAYGLLSLSQKSTHNLTPNSFSPISTTSPMNDQQQHVSVMNIDEITHATKTNYAKNKFLEPGILHLSNIKDMAVVTLPSENERPSGENYGFFGKTCVTRPLTYPYVMSVVETPSLIDEPMSVSSENTDISSRIIDVTTPSDTTSESRNIKHFHVIQRYVSDKDYSSDESYADPERSTERSVIVTQNLRLIPDKMTDDLRKRKLSEDALIAVKLQKNDEVMDLSIRPTTHEDVSIRRPNGANFNDTLDSSDYHDFRGHHRKLNGETGIHHHHHQVLYDAAAATTTTLDVRIPAPSPKTTSYVADFDNSAMETLADIATKQVKLEKNAMAKSVASEYLKLATKQEFQGETERIQAKGVNDLIVKPEGSKSCTICSKTFNKPSQLRLHMNVHYLERPFRCDSCSVSFRTKGHLQKHERSASHHNKLSSSPALSSSEPRPFKCADCNIAFRIHGHLAKHLRSKMHIMKLECLAKIPFGLYAELERSNSLLTEINTADGDQCLESLKTLAKKVFLNDPGKLKHLVETPSSELETD